MDRMEKTVKKININIVAALLGGIAFVLIYGVKILNPLYTDWLLTGGDPSQHYLGWEFFRRSDWYFPLGLTDQLAYPLKTSVIYTDSIPIFAVFFKLFRSILPRQFQYFGIWGLLCFVLQGYYAAKILGERSSSKTVILAGSIFFIVSPVMVFRMYYHTALAAHWLILLAIYFYSKHEKEYRDIFRPVMQWGILGILIGSIHLYFVPMCGAILLGYILCSIWKERKIRIRFFYPGISFSVGLFLTVYLLGGFSSGADTGTNNLGLFSFNLNAFLNPMSYSTLLKNTSLWDWPFYTQGQYEGFSYLGMGIILLCVCGIGLMIKNICRRKKPSVYQIMTVLMSVGLIVMAASPTITWNDKLLLQLPYSSTIYKYWGIFGSCGRMAWPVVYFLMIFGITSIGNMKWKRKEISNVIIILACLVQVIDLSGQLYKRHENYSEKVVYQSPLAGSVWDDIISSGEYKHVVWVTHNVDHNDVIQVAVYAMKNDMTMGNFYFARGIDKRDIIEEQLQNTSEDCVYVFLKSDDTFGYEIYENYEDVLHFYPCGDYMIGTVKSL
ncbi:MAG: hypothetical protein BHW48_03885 [Roseburia sp. CAG:10041_57]|nr:MAG: hypothetical protein BHW48_03885 [Roseburia sp. CAG:10041_57]